MLEGCFGDIRSVILTWSVLRLRALSSINTHTHTHTHIFTHTYIHTSSKAALGIQKWLQKEYEWDTHNICFTICLFLHSALQELLLGINVAKMHRLFPEIALLDVLVRSLKAHSHGFLPEAPWHHVSLEAPGSVSSPLSSWLTALPLSKLEVSGHSVVLRPFLFSYPGLLSEHICSYSFRYHLQIWLSKLYFGSSDFP